MTEHFRVPGGEAAADLLVHLADKMSVEFGKQNT